MSADNYLKKYKTGCTLHIVLSSSVILFCDLQNVLSHSCHIVKLSLFFFLAKAMFLKKNEKFNIIFLFRDDITFLGSIFVRLMAFVTQA